MAAIHRRRRRNQRYRQALPALVTGACVEKLDIAEKETPPYEINLTSRI
jgi:hypothetical protein